AWLNTRKCAACHHVPLTLWALGEAERHGYAIDSKFVADTVESLLGSKDKLLSSRIFPNPADPPDPRPPGPGAEHGAAHAGHRGPVVAVAERGAETKSEAHRGRNRQEAATRRLVGVLCDPPAAAD